MSLLSNHWDKFHFSRQPPRRRFGCRVAVGRRRQSRCRAINRPKIARVNRPLDSNNLNHYPTYPPPPLRCPCFFHVCLRAGDRVRQPQTHLYCPHSLSLHPLPSWLHWRPLVERCSCSPVVRPTPTGSCLTVGGHRPLVASARQRRTFSSRILCRSWAREGENQQGWRRNAG